MSKNLQEWLHEGEQLYEEAVREYQALETQIDDLEKRLAAKQAEVNQIAQVIGKPPVEGNRRLTAQLVSEQERNSSPSSPSVIARALSGGARAFSRP